MKKLYSLPLIACILLCGILFTACSDREGANDFVITNTLDIDRPDEPVVLTRAQIIEKYGEMSIQQGQVPLPYVDGIPLPSQIDDVDLDGNWDELAFTLNLPGNASKNITLEFIAPEEYPPFNPRTNVRFGVLGENGVQNLEELNIAAHEVPPPPFSRFQMDGPAWENDKVGFRHYIDGRNARDVYGKVVAEMSLDTVGISSEGTLEDNYHVMLPWGRDILSVGNSLGLGGLAILRNNQPVRLGVRTDDEINNVDITKYQLIKEGPVRTIFRLTFDGWQTGIDKVSLFNDVTIWAGSYSHTNDIQITESDFSTDTLLVGLVNIHNDNPLQTLEDSETGFTAFYTHDKQTYDKEWFLGMGIIFLNEQFINDFEAPVSGPGITNSYLLQFEMSGEKKLQYDVLAGWELSDERFSDAGYFTNYVKELVQKKANPVIIE